MKVATPELLARLADLALVEVDTLIAGLDAVAAADVLAAFVADVEDALGQARDVLRDVNAALGTGADPLGLLDRGVDLRAQGGETALAEALARLGERAAARRDLARLEERVRGVLPRLLQADRRLTAMVAPG